MIRRSLVLAALSVTALTLTASAAPAKVQQFQSPSHNIGCVMVGSGVRCDIRNHGWPTPLTPPSCELDYGQGVQVGKRGRGSYVCAGDTTLGQGSVLAYGDRIGNKRFRCASKPKGMRCVNRKNKHGFFLSSQEVRLF